MEPTGIMLWLSTMIKCNLFFSDGVFLSEYSMSQVVSEDPWTLLRRVKGPDSCAVLLLNGVDEYHEALPHMHKIQSVKITVVLTVGNISEEVCKNLKDGKNLEFERHILVTDEKEHVTGTLDKKLFYLVLKLLCIMYL